MYYFTFHLFVLNFWSSNWWLRGIWTDFFTLSFFQCQYDMLKYEKETSGPIFLFRFRVVGKRCKTSVDLCINTSKFPAHMKQNECHRCFDVSYDFPVLWRRKKDVNVYVGFCLYVFFLNYTLCEIKHVIKLKKYAKFSFRKCIRFKTENLRKKLKTIIVNHGNTSPLGRNLLQEHSSCFR